MAPVVVIAHIECKSGSAGTVQAMLETLKRDTHSKEGLCHKLYDPVQDIENENKFAVYENWHSMEDIDAHFQEDHFKKFAEELRPLLASPNALSIGKYYSMAYEESVPQACGNIQVL